MKTRVQIGTVKNLTNYWAYFSKGIIGRTIISTCILENMFISLALDPWILLIYVHFQ